MNLSSRFHSLVCFMMASADLWRSGRSLNGTSAMHNARNLLIVGWPD